MAVPQKMFIRSSQVTNHGSVRMNLKQSNSQPCGSLNPNQIQEKFFVEKSLRSKLWPVSSAKLVMWQVFHLSNVERSILSDTPQFVCLKFPEKFEKRTRDNESLFTMAIDGSFAVQPWLSTQWLLYIPPHQEKIAWSTIFVSFWKCLNLIGKTKTNDGRTLKHSE